MVRSEAELLEQVTSDPGACDLFRSVYTGSWDALDALTWRVDSTASGFTGAANPGAAKRDLEFIVHARPVGVDGEDARARASVELHDLLERGAFETAALDFAIAKYATLTSDEEPVSEPERHPPVEHQPGSSRNRKLWIVVGAVVVIAGALLIGAVQGSPCRVDIPCSASDTIPTATPSPAAPGPQLTGYDALWDSLLGRYPDAVRPDVELVGFVSADQLTTTLVSCLNTAGFPEAQLVDEAIQVKSVGSGARREAINVAMFTCQLQHPLDPLAVFDRAQTVDEAAYENANLAAIGRPDPGSGRLLVVGEGFQVFAYRLTLTDQDPLYCAELAVDATHTSSGACASIDQFRAVGIRPSGLIWSPNGDLKLTGRV